jgi:hypothetical protein
MSGGPYSTDKRTEEWRGQNYSNANLFYPQSKTKKRPASLHSKKKNIQGKNYYGFSSAPFTPRYLKGEKCKMKV